MISLEKLQKQLIKEQQKNQEEKIKELLFSGGGGGVCFLMGYMQGVIEIIGKEKLRQYKLGGVSSGSVLAIIMHIILHCDHYTMEELFDMFISPMQDDKCRRFYGFLTTGQLIVKNAHNFKQILRNHPEIPSFTGNVHFITSVFGLPFIKPQVLDDFEDVKNLADGLKSSCAFPFFLNFGIFQRYKSKKTLDGGFTRTIPYKYKHSQKIYLHNLPPQIIKNPFFKKPKNTKIIYLTPGTEKKFPIDYLIYDRKWAENQFQAGYLHSYKQINIILKAFQVENSTAYQNNSIHPSL